MREYEREREKRERVGRREREGKREGTEGILDFLVCCIHRWT
jgi:hypothetical protein